MFNLLPSCLSAFQHGSISQWQWFSKRGAWTSSLSITWELFIKAHFWGPTTDVLNHKLGGGGRSPAVRVLTSSLGDWHVWKFERHWSREQRCAINSVWGFGQLSPPSGLEDSFRLSQMRGSFVISVCGT